MFHFFMHLCLSHVCAYRIVLKVTVDLNYQSSDLRLCMPHGEWQNFGNDIVCFGEESLPTSWFYIKKGYDSLKQCDIIGVCAEM